MYKCKECGNKNEFEELNVVKTYVNQATGERIDHVNSLSEEFFYRVDVVCLQCGNTLEDGCIEETKIEIGINLK